MASVAPWSRPPRQEASPAPLYLIPNGESIAYCRRCGRVIGSGKIQNSLRSKSTVKYCSQGCRSRGLAQVDRTIERTFVSLLQGEDPSGSSLKQKIDAPPSPDLMVAGPGKSSRLRSTVMCTRVEELVFGARNDDGRSVESKNATPIGQDESPADQSERQEFQHAIEPEAEQPPVTSSAIRSDMIWNVGATREKKDRQGGTDQTRDEGHAQNNLAGRRKAKEREAVRCAARRLCAFGIAVTTERDSCLKGKHRRKYGKRAAEEDSKYSLVDSTETRLKSEAVLQNGKVVEPSFAKGDFGIRWRQML